MSTANEKAINAACAWAVKIANDNSFHYGRTKWAHKYGCYFCGTQSAKVKAGASKAQAAKTYCCNPFVVAAWVHGAGVDKKCANGGLTIPLSGGSTSSMLKHNFKQVSKPSSVSSLKKGDVLLTPTHCMLYIGDGKIAHAAHHDNGKKGSYWNSSICVQSIPSKQWKRTKKVFRYYGNGSFTDDAPFTIGKTYVLLDDMNIRTGAGTNCGIVKAEDMTAYAQEHLTEDGLLSKDTRITFDKVSTDSKGATWGHLKSGWICLCGSTGTMFVKEAE